MQDANAEIRAKDPQLCLDMTDVRLGVDAVDVALIELLAKRFDYMRAAARIKQDRDAVRDEGRKAQVLSNVKEAALQYGIPVDVIETLWDQLVEASIAYEFRHWDSVNP
jgi:isochorismate pyruvate lyase